MKRIPLNVHLKLSVLMSAERKRESAFKLARIGVYEFVMWLELSYAATDKTECTIHRSKQ